MAPQLQFMRVPVHVLLPDGSTHGNSPNAPCKAFVFDGVLQVFEQRSVELPVELIFTSPLVEPFDGSFDLVPPDASEPRRFVTEAGEVGMWQGPGCACSFHIKRFMPRQGPPAVPAASGSVRFRVLNDRRECIDFEGGKCASYATRGEADLSAQAFIEAGLPAMVESFYAQA